MTKYYAVTEDSKMVIMEDLDDEEIINMIGSDYYPGVFVMTDDGIRYADVDLDENTVTWLPPTIYNE